MKKLIFAFMVLCGMCAPAKAEEPTWKEIQRLELAYQTLNAVDALQTIDCLNRNVCEEFNPIYGKNPSTEKVIGFKVAGGIIHYPIGREIYKRDPEAARMFQYVSIGLQGGVVAANLRFAF